MNKRNHLKTTIFALGAWALSLSACKKDKKVLTQKIAATKGVYVLCEGSWMDGKSTISYYDIENKTTVKDYYKQVNGTELGETANDLKVYGSKLYCVVSGTQGEKKSFVDVMNVNTGKTIKRISFNTDTEGKMPRFITFYKNKAYVSSYDGTISRIDTATYTIDELQLKNGTANAAGLEGLAVANGKLYVAGSDHFLYTNSLKDKVVVVDLATFTKTKDITVNYNPQKIAVTETGDLFVTSWGNYADIKSALQKISSTTDAVTQTEDYDLGAIAINKNAAWVAKDVYATTPGIKALNVSTGKIGNDLITDGTTIATPYGLTINPFDNSVVVSDSGASKAFVFGTDGKVKYSFETGANPQAAAFSYSYKYE